LRLEERPAKSERFKNVEKWSALAESTGQQTSAAPNQDEILSIEKYGFETS
jgi:hypothetical protein